MALAEPDRTRSLVTSLTRPRFAHQCNELAKRLAGIAVLEYRPTETLPGPQRDVAEPARLCRPRRLASSPHCAGESWIRTAGSAREEFRFYPVRNKGSASTSLQRRATSLASHLVDMGGPFVYPWPGQVRSAMRAKPRPPPAAWPRRTPACRASRRAAKSVPLSPRWLDTRGAFGAAAFMLLSEAMYLGLAGWLTKIRATVAFPVPTSLAVFLMPVPAAREAPAALAMAQNKRQMRLLRGGTDGLSTHRWREPDSNHRSRSLRKGSLGYCRPDR